MNNVWKNICTDCANCTEYVNGYYCEVRRMVVYPNMNPMAYRFCANHKPGKPMKSEERIERLEAEEHCRQIANHYGYDPNYQGA